MDFETSISRLEEIVNMLESSNLNLDKSVEIYEEGMKLSKICQDKLLDAQRKVYVLKNEPTKPKKRTASKKKTDADKAIEDNFNLFGKD